MTRFLNRAAAAAVGLALLVTPATGSVSWADDNPDFDESGPGGNQDFDSPHVEGIVYNIRDFQDGKVKVLTVLNNDLGQNTFLYIRDPKLVALVNNKTVCTNRFVQADGVRTGPRDLDVEGLTVDLGRDCGTPPK